MGYDKKTSTITIDGDMEQFKKDLTDHAMNMVEQLKREPMSTPYLGPAAPATTKAGSNAAVRAIEFMFGPHAGWRRLLSVLSLVWLAYWLFSAAAGQYKLWTRCTIYCDDLVGTVWGDVLIALAGPIGLALSVRVVRWIVRGFNSPRA